MRALRLAAGLAFGLCSSAVASGPPKQPSAGELLRKIERLSTLGSVLYVAAHPDDENTRLLAYLANERLVRAAYLSVTRGEGGQNLIGPEQGLPLGLIRTQELLAARRIDGAEQFFTRARDFGFSKSAEETLSIWGKDTVLADIVWVIRSFKPDVIITRFSPKSSDTHGHHTASAQLTVEAFRAAADPTYHPEQIKRVGTWRARRLLWNKFFFNRPVEETAGLVKLDVGGYNPLLGVSYGEMAAVSRSMHKSQGFGAASSRGRAFEYFELLAGDPVQRDIFEGVDLSWARAHGSKKLLELLAKAPGAFKPSAPHESIPLLLEIQSELQSLPASPWKEEKQKEVVEAIVAAAGLWVDATAAEYNVAPGTELKVNATVLNRSPAPLELEEVRLAAEKTVPLHQPLTADQPAQTEQVLRIPLDAALSIPYWLAEPPAAGTFRVEDPTFIGLPENPPSLTAQFLLRSGRYSFRVERPIAYKWTDPVEGERYRPVRIVPRVMINPELALLVFPDTAAKPLRVTLKAGDADVAGTLRPRVPEGWQLSPAAQSFNLAVKGEETEVLFQVDPPQKTGTGVGWRSGVLSFAAEVDGRQLSRGYTEIQHSHIPVQAMFPEAEVKLARFDLKKRKTNIGYVLGPGDEVPTALRQAGYRVTILQDEALRNEPLDRFDAVVIGVRAYNVNGRLPFYHRKLMDYVAAGGTMVVQYSTSNRLSRAPPEIGPYPFEISQERVTDETAAVSFEIPNHSVLREPNRLGPADFDGWIQERGLYFAGKWSDRYEALLSMHDPGEPPRKGGLLVTRFGKGAFVYTGMAFFRQLPAGVPGAYRLFANLIAYGR